MKTVESIHCIDYTRDNDFFFSKKVNRSFYFNQRYLLQANKHNLFICKEETTFVCNILGFFGVTLVILCLLYFYDTFFNWQTLDFAIINH